MNKLTLEAAIEVEKSIRDELKKEIEARWESGKRDAFLHEMRAQLRTQCFRIAVLKRKLRHVR